jgi:dihydrolipoamide dehydrogenase
MNFDLLIIGTGPGGYVAAIRAAQLGMKVGVVEKESLGGICLNWGCIPTKALLKSAQVFDYVKHAAQYGIEIKGDALANFKEIVKRSRGVADKMSKGVNFLMRKNKITVISGMGQLTAKKSVKVTDAQGQVTEYTAKNIIIATGARARQLPNIPVDGKKIIEYRRAMSLEQQPKSLVVVGSGAIGVEFAYFYNAIGTKVTIVEYMDNILPREDVDVSKEMLKIFKKSGIEIRTGAAVQKVDTSGAGCVVTVADNKTGKQETIACDVVLSAAGISPNTENIGLESLGIKTNKGGFIEVDKHYQTNVPGIYAIGDVIPTQALAHVASAEGIQCVEHLAGMHTEPIDYNNIPGCTYCYPEVASVGYTEQQAKEAGYEVRVGKFPFSASGKASASGANEGFVKVIFDKKYGEFLGCHMVGANVTEMIAEIVAARKLETTGHEILKAVHPHPTMSEAVMEATADAYGEVIHL